MAIRNFMVASLLFCAACTGAETAIKTAPTPVDPGPKQIALTYDDAPLGDGPIYTGTERTQAFIEQLDAAGSGPVAIFVTTRGLDQADGQTRIQAYADAGHRIANHSDQHIWASRTDIEAYIADIDAAERKLEGFDHRRPWFRFPFLDEGGMGEDNKDAVRRDAYRAALDARGLISGYVTVDTFDWHLDRLWSRAVQNGDRVDQAALSRVYVDMVVDAAAHYDALGQQVLGRRPVQVLLLHENDLAARFTADVIRALRADGWEIVDPDLAFADQIAAQIPETRFSGMGRISALAADAGLWERGVIDHWSASEQGIDDKVADYGAFVSDASENMTE
ncbi:MAG: polysaccharide deacetylase family protein [Pseudomonadota bacterium]